MKISMLDVGQGDSIVLQTSEGFNALFDGGSTSKKNTGKYRIYSYLKYAGIRSLDYVFISHPDKDHVSGIYELIDMCDNTFEIKTLFCRILTICRGHYQKSEKRLIVLV